MHLKGPRATDCKSFKDVLSEVVKLWLRWTDWFGVEPGKGWNKSEVYSKQMQTFFYIFVLVTPRASPLISHSDTPDLCPSFLQAQRLWHQVLLFMASQPQDQAVHKTWVSFQGHSDGFVFIERQTDRPIQLPVFHLAQILFICLIFQMRQWAEVSAQLRAVTTS